MSAQNYCPANMVVLKSGLSDAEYICDSPLLPDNHQATGLPAQYMSSTLPPLSLSDLKQMKMPELWGEVFSDFSPMDLP